MFKTPVRAEVGKKKRYLFLWRWVVIATSIVALSPMVILSFVNFFQYKRALHEEVGERARHVTASTKRSLEFFLAQRRSALTFVTKEKTFEDLGDQTKLESIFENLQDVLGDIVDLGFIDSSGKQISYVGPYDLKGKNYSEQDWFHEVTIRGYYVSDVFMGYRHIPHFVIAVARKYGAGKPCVLRATIDSDILEQQMRSLNIEPPSEAFLINREGILQTPSRYHGNLLEKSHVNVPPYSEQWVVREAGDSSGKTSILGYAYIKSSPFILIIIKYPATSLANWFNLKRGLWLFLIFSMIVTLLIIMTMAYFMVSRIREADSQRAMVLHKVEYQAKMASLGRMAAGVAHEINNPMAIINEKAGMLKDIATFNEDFSYKEKTLRLMDSILDSVERCSRITHRLLGFASYIDVKIEAIDVETLVKEVISFLEVEANYRNIEIEVKALDDNLPMIKSDRGQLQQVLLNILNNSLNALEGSDREGLIQVFLKSEDSSYVSMTIEDNGPGISKRNLVHIFEPFYTTRSKGTGLGLSITYGIVEKLGGQIEVKSEVGVGTSFKVTLPVKTK